VEPYWLSVVEVQLWTKSVNIMIVYNYRSNLQFKLYWCMVEYIECSIILQWNEGLLYPIILSQTGVFHYIIDTYNQAQTKNSESHKSWHALVYAQNGKLEFLIAASFAIVYDYKGHRRDIV